MTGSTPGIILIAIVSVIALAAWLALVFHADAHPARRRRVPSAHGIAGQATRMTAWRPAEITDYAPREKAGSRPSGPSGQDGETSARPAGGITPDKARTG